MIATKVELRDVDVGESALLDRSDIETDQVDGVNARRWPAAVELHPAGDLANLAVTPLERLADRTRGQAHDEDEEQHDEPRQALAQHFAQGLVFGHEALVQFFLFALWHYIKQSALRANVPRPGTPNVSVHSLLHTALLSARLTAANGARSVPIAFTSRRRCIGAFSFPSSAPPTLPPQYISSLVASSSSTPAVSSYPYSCKACAYCPRDKVSPSPATSLLLKKNEAAGVVGWAIGNQLARQHG